MKRRTDCQNSAGLAVSRTIHDERGAGSDDPPAAAKARRGDRVADYAPSEDRRISRIGWKPENFLFTETPNPSMRPRSESPRRVWRVSRHAGAVQSPTSTLLQMATTLHHKPIFAAQRGDSRAKVMVTVATLPSRPCVLTRNRKKGSGETKMRRVNQVLRRLEKDRAWYQVHGYSSATVAKFDAQIAEEQAIYAHLAGVPLGGQS